MNLEGKNEKESLLQGLIDAIDKPAILCNETGNIILFNKLAKSLAGGLELIEGLPVFEFAKKIETGNQVERLIRNFILTNEEINAELNLVDEKLFRIRISKVLNEGFLFEIANINTERSIEEALEKSLEKYKSTYNHSPIMMHTTDNGGHIVMVSDYWCEKLGFERNEVIGQPIVSFMSDKSKRRWMELSDSKKVGEATKDFELRMIKKDKSEIDVLMSTQIELDSLGNVDRIISGMTEITNLKKAENKIKQLTNRLLLATQLGNIGVWEFDRYSNSVFWEEQMHKIFPDIKTPITGLASVEKMFLEEDRQVLYNILNRIKQGESYMEEEVRIFYKGELRYIRTFTRVIRDEHHKMKSLIGVVYDVTSDKQLQQDLKSSLDEKNILIREVHHRVKNNMQVISSLLSLKSYELKEPSIRNVFEGINKRIKAMAVIHDKLYTFYNVSEVDVAEYLINIKDEIQTIYDRKDIEIQIEADEVKMNIDKALLIGLIVSELISNAIKHSFLNSRSGLINVKFISEDKSYLKVLNNGVKIPENVLSQKGIGMTLVRTFVSQLHGDISMHHGNGFKISF